MSWVRPETGVLPDGAGGPAGAILDGVHDAYLARLDAALTGPLRARRDLLREVADHLEDATDAYVATGLDLDDAAARARRDLGSVEELVPSFQEVLAVAASRRTAWALLGALGFQPFLWDGGLDLASRGPLEAPDTLGYRLLDETVEVGGFLVILGALLAVVVSGMGQRWLTAGRASARATAVLALAAALVVPALGVTMTAMASGATPRLWALVGVLMVAPLAGVGVLARRTLAAC